MLWKTIICCGIHINYVWLKMSKLFKKGKNRVEGEKIIKKYTLHFGCGRLGGDGRFRPDPAALHPLVAPHVGEGYIEGGHILAQHADLIAPLLQDAADEDDRNREGAHPGPDAAEGQDI